MSLLNTIKEDLLALRKSEKTESVKIKVSLLTTLYSEAANIGLNDKKRESTDEEVIAVIKKFIKSIDESLSVSDNVCTKLLLEKQVLSDYLPSQLTKDQLETIVKDIVVQLQCGDDVSKPISIGVIMGSLKKTYSGQFDGKLASEVIRNVLQS